MKPQNFSLLPFPGTRLLPFKISGTFFRQGNTFGLDYHLFGHLADIEIIPPANKPSRRIGLWENTCFEFFIGPRNSARYWEFNLSPSGDWNVFRFENYRVGLFEEKTIPSLPLKVLVQPDSFRLVMEFDLSIIIPVGQALEMAVCAVIKTRRGEVPLWALTHPGPEADFHHRDSFIIKL
jgi:hypothetical protein